MRARRIVGLLWGLSAICSGVLELAGVHNARGDGDGFQWFSIGALAVIVALQKEGNR